MRLGLLSSLGVCCAVFATVGGQEHHAQLSAAAPGSRGLRGHRQLGGETVRVLEPIKSIHPSYEVISNEYLEHYGANVTLYRHIKTGAEVMSVTVDDDNKVFAISFRTIPTDNTGVAHILEHSVLDGSRKYPIKDVFSKMKGSSLKTYLNAFTMPDRTSYPVASQNTKDFYNLADVYLDAVFHPKAVEDPLILMQEGARLELPDPNGPLEYNGVVYSEMKGKLSDPDGLMDYATLKAVFPDTSLGLNFGGDPKDIPNLTFEGLCNFYHKHYHPSNSRAFFWGDDDPLERLKLLDGYLSEYEKQEALPDLQIQHKKSEPWIVTERFPATESTKDKGMVAVNWLLNEEPITVKDELKLLLIRHILVGSTAGLLYQKLIQSGLGESVIDDFGGSYIQSTMAFGMKGVKEADFPKVEDLILQSLKENVKDGFPKEAIEAALNTLELSFREIQKDSGRDPPPRGLSFFNIALSTWTYGRDPLEGFRFQEPLESLKADLAAPDSRVLEDMVQTVLLDNTHRVTMRMVPDVNLEAATQKEEAARLAAIKAGLDEQGLQAIIDASAKLKAAQEAEDPPEVIALLPHLTLEDLNKKQKEVPVKVTTVKGVPVLRTNLSTSGIFYLDVALNVTDLPDEYVPFLPTFLDVLKSVGTSKLDSTQLTRKIQTHTGGIRTSVEVKLKQPRMSELSETPTALPVLLLSGKALASKADKLVEILLDVLLDANFDNQQVILGQLREAKAGFRTSAVSSGSSFASVRLSARYSMAGLLMEMTEGFTFGQSLDGLIDMATNDWPTFKSRLEGIRDFAVNKDALVLSITGDDDTYRLAQTPVEHLIESIPVRSPRVVATGTSNAWASRLAMQKRDNEGFAVPTRVNYVTKGGRMYGAGEVVPPHADVISKWIADTYLWMNVRVRGGAYGVGSSISPASGVFSMASSRDPNIASTLRTYDDAADYLLKNGIAEGELNKAIIATIGKIDKPSSPAIKARAAMFQYLVGESQDARQAWRDGVLSTRTSDVKGFAERLKEYTPRLTLAVVGSRAALEEANKSLNETQRMTITTVM